MSTGGGSVLARAVIVLGGDASEAEAMMNSTQKSMEKLGESMKNIGDLLMTHVTLPIIAMGTAAVHAWGEHEDAVAKTTAMIAASGGAAGVTEQHMIKLAESLQETTTYSHDVTLAAEGLLLSFEQVRNSAGKGNDVFDRTIIVSQKLALLMDRDLSTAVLGVAKAMEDPETGMLMLRKAGIMLDESIKQQIKTLVEHGEVLKAQKLLLTVLEGKYGDLAKAQRDAPLGQLRVVWNDINIAMEKAGKIIFEQIQPALAIIDSWAKSFAKMDPATQHTVVVIGELAAAVGPVLVGIGLLLKAIVVGGVFFAGLATSVGTLIVSFGGLASGAGAFSVSIGGILAPLALLSAAIISVLNTGRLLIENWGAVKIQAISLWLAIEGAWHDGIVAVLGWIQSFLLGLTTLGAVISGMPGPVGDFGKALVGLSSPATDAAAKVGEFMASIDTTYNKDLADAGVQIAKLTNSFEGLSDGVATAVKKVVKATDTLAPHWAAPVLKALDDLKTALDLADQMAANSSQAFDKAGAYAAAYAKAVDEISKAHAPLKEHLGDIRDVQVALVDLIHTQDEWANTAIGDILTKTLKANADQAEVAGKAFNQTTEDSNAWAAAVSALTARFQGLNVMVGTTGMTVGQFIAKANEMAHTAVAVDTFNQSMETAGTMSKLMGVDFDLNSARLSAYTQLLNDAVASHADLSKAIGTTGMNAIQLAKKIQELTVAFTIGTQIKKSMGDALDAIVGFAFGAKQSFADFVRTAIEDLAKLILKLMVFKAIHDWAIGSSSGFAGALLQAGFASGGYLPAGGVGMVGENGPELISAGTAGVRITPLPASGTNAGDASGQGMRIEINVNALDSAGVADFFENNQGMVASAMLRAAQRSSALGRRMARG